MVLISNLNIENIRAIRNTPLDVKDRGLIIIGDNGTGKSSIVDAIEFFLTQSLEYLGSIQSLSIPRNLPHIRATSFDDCKVEITFETNSGPVVLTRTNGPLSPSPNIHPELEAYIDAGRKGGVILRRAKILDFIYCQPAERYQIIAEIMGIEDYRPRMLAVKSVVDLRSQALALRESELQSLKTETHSEFDTTDERIILDALNNQIDQLHLPQQASLQEIARETDEWLKEHSVLAKQERCLDSLQEGLLPLERASQIAHNIENELAGIGSDELGADEVVLLEKGLAVVQKATDDLCPLCGSNINRVQLTKKLEVRLKEIGILREKRNRIISFRVGLGQKIREAVSKVVDAKSQIESINGIEAAKTMLGKLTVKIEQQLPSPNIAQINNTKTMLESTVSQLKSLFNTVPTPSQDNQVQSAKASALSAIDLLRRVNQKTLETQKYLKASQEAQKIYDVYVEKGKAVIQDYLSTMLSDLQKFFDFLHPNDSHGNILLEMRPSYPASTMISLDMFGLGNSDPRAFLSEGHLDSLGLCVFLAFVRHFREDCSLIVLDDVISSIDSGHRSRIAELLFDEFIDKQLIITTHEPIWAETLIRMINARGLTAEFSVAEIFGWTVDAGPRLRPHRDDSSRIDSFLNSGDHDVAAGLARVGLEGVLRKTCERLKIALDYKDKEKDKTLNHFFTGLRNKTRSSFPPSITEVQEMFSALTDVESTAVWANHLLHHNEIRRQITVHESRAFCDAVKELNRVFKCRQCNAELKKTGNQIRCPGRNCINPTIIQL